MSDPATTTDGPSLWQAVRGFLTGRNEGASLRESLEEAIEEHQEADAHADDLDASERLMLRNLLHLGERKAGDIAVQRGAIIAFDLREPFPALVRRFRDAGHSRMPVFEESLDDIKGMIHVKDVYATIAETFDDAVSSAPFLDFDSRRLVRPVLYVPPSKPVLDLLAEMRQSRTHMAVIVDEYGGTDGLVTIEDIVEEIVGEIEDEHDDELETLLSPCVEGCWNADARLPIPELEAALGVPFDDPDEDVDTLGGLVFVMAGRVPAMGEIIEHPNGWRFEVTAANGLRVERFRLHPPFQEDDQ
ncbi:hemolysin family protein [Sandaracinobacteroides saxicola]|uniref:HlyC/CorC family transporter n=1 Tax=Sandaracinobacteroides saxicola TaxID=2759707 RepID=A0A7G5ILZ1_9SPHN|nr:hemolysin family protein [Sandaracinobacteroides saxicola]QMW24383.1 HlyC/CorC family transporter [Sandaracinobacteroides saxicola]